MRKKALLTTLIILLAASASGNILIEQPETDSDISDLDKKYRIGLINTGNDEINLTVSKSVSTDLSVYTPESITLEPSEITETPSQDREWYYLGDNQYAEIHYLDVQSEIPLDADTRSHRFDLLFSRVYETEENRPNVETVQEFSFEIFSTSDRIQTGFSSGNNDEKNQTTPEEDEEAAPTDTSEESDTEEVNSTSQQSSNRTNEDSHQEDEDSGGVSGVTILLLLGVILTMAWLLKEVFA